ncbi:mannosyltransferase family protein [Streptacidiphilus sp. P02-A3a]|uniref:mannosyltransferase family protein n=1 Tax=Streptacidiphilus sp. P02-A3a TaxID=2704468 RepID=UPI001CDC9169|nr:mannosyltransferase family protein [Streptacidiphilus sp. P02-A3a]
MDEPLLDDAQRSDPRTAPAKAPAKAPAGAGAGARALRAFGVPLGVAAGSALLHCLLLLWLDSPTESFAGRFHVWDAQFYVQIAQSGYPHGYAYANGQLTGNNLAFFPLYPLLIRIVHTVSGLAWGTSAVVVAWLCAFAAAVVVHRLVRSLASERVAGFAVALVFCQPMAVSLWIAYTESLFLLLAAAALLAARRESWLWAGVLTCLAGLTRSTGIALAAALVVAVVLAARREHRLGWRMVAGGVLGCLGMPAYLGWVGLRVGQLDGWSHIQSAGWGTAWDWGSSTWDFLTSTLHNADGWVQVSVAFVLIGYTVACAAALLERPWPPLAVYGVLILAASLGQSNYYHSKPRLLVPVLLAVLPLASSLARARRANGLLALAGIGFFGCWFGVYMLTVWPYAI